VNFVEKSEVAFCDGDVEKPPSTG